MDDARRPDNEPASRPERFWILPSAVVAVLTIVAAVASGLAGASTLAVAGIVLFGLAVIGAFLWLTSPDRPQRWGDLGRSIIGGVVLALIVGGFQSELARRSHQHEERQALRLSLSLQRDLSGVQLQGEEISGFSLAGKRMVGADLSDADAQQTTFVGSNLSLSDLSRAQLQNADISHATLVGARLEKANLNGLRAGGVNMRGARLPYAQLNDARLENADLVGACLAGADLAGAQLSAADLRNADLNGANLVGVRWVGDFGAADLSGASLVGAKLGQGLPRSLKPGVASASIKRVATGRPLARAAIARAKRDRVVRVLDGDDVVLRRAGDLRLIGVDAPPLSTALGTRARDFARRSLYPGLEVRYLEDKRTTDELRRHLGYLVMPDGRMFNELITSQGYALPLRTPPNLAYESRIAGAVQSARLEGRGIWRAGCPTREG